MPLARLRTALRALLRRRTMEQDLDEELRLRSGTQPGGGVVPQRRARRNPEVSEGPMGCRARFVRNHPVSDVALHFALQVESDLFVELMLRFAPTEGPTEKDA